MNDLQLNSREFGPIDGGPPSISRDFNFAIFTSLMTLFRPQRVRFTEREILQSTPRIPDIRGSINSVSARKITLYFLPEGLPPRAGIH
jgi:hypothetical protein